jgi:hypothetical protein
MEGMEKQLTAIDWLLENLITEPFSEADFEHNSNCWDKAKEMEKEQMKDSYKQGFAYRDTWNWELDVDWDKDSTQENNQEFEQYYNETFKSE